MRKGSPQNHSVTESCIPLQLIVFPSDNLWQVSDAPMRSESFMDKRNKLLLWLSLLLSTSYTHTATPHVCLTSTTESRGVVESLEGNGAIELLCELFNAHTSTQPPLCDWYMGQWELNKTTIDPSTMQFYGNGNRRLYLHNLKKELSGPYSCCVSIQSKDLCSNTLKIVIHGHPTFTPLVRNSMVVRRGSNVTLSMEISGGGFRHWHSIWTRDGLYLTHTGEDLNFTVLSTQIVHLVLINVDDTNNGEYRVALSNGHWQEDSSPIILIVQASPDAPLPPKLQPLPTSIGTGSQLSVQWEMPTTQNGDSQVTMVDRYMIQYRPKDGYLHLWQERVAVKSRAVLTGLSPCTTYELIVEACNSVGCSKPSPVATAKTLSNDNTGTLSKNLYMGQISGMLLFAELDSIRPLCISHSQQLDESSSLCHVKTYRNDTFSVVPYDRVFVVHLHCDLRHTPLDMCNYSCPEKSAKCSSSQRLVNLHEFCGTQGTMQPAGPTEAEGTVTPADTAGGLSGHHKAGLSGGAIGGIVAAVLLVVAIGIVIAGILIYCRWSKS